MKNKQTCYRCKKEKSELKQLDDKGFCLTCYVKVKQLKKGSKGFDNFKCPICNNLMTAGKASIHGTICGFIVFGFSHQHLWFEPSDGGFKEKMVLDSNGSTISAYCEKCKLLLSKTIESVNNAF
jgi:hypothetical protein